MDGAGPGRRGNLILAIAAARPSGRSAGPPHDGATGIAANGNSDEVKNTGKRHRPRRDPRACGCRRTKQSLYKGILTLAHGVIGALVKRQYVVDYADGDINEPSNRDSGIFPRRNGRERERRIAMPV